MKLEFVTDLPRFVIDFLLVLKTVKKEIVTISKVPQKKFQRREKIIFLF